MWRVILGCWLSESQAQDSRLCVRGEGRIACLPAPDLPTTSNREIDATCHTSSIVASSWWWAYTCPKHVEQIIRSIKHCVASSWFSSTHITTMHGQTHVKFKNFVALHTYICLSVPCNALPFCQSSTSLSLNEIYVTPSLHVAEAYVSFCKWDLHSEVISHYLRCVAVSKVIASLSDQTSGSEVWKTR